MNFSNDVQIYDCDRKGIALARDPPGTSAVFLVCLCVRVCVRVSVFVCVCVCVFVRVSVQEALSKAAVKKSRAPVQLDLGDMLAALEKQQQAMRARQLNNTKPLTYTGTHAT